MVKKTLISPASEKGRFDDLVVEGKYLRQSSLYKQILPGTPTRPKTICVNPVILSNLSSCFCAFLWLKTSVSSVPSVAKYLFNQRNPRLINDLRLRKITYEKIKLFLQNEPNFRKSQINLTALLTREYVQMDTWSIRKNEPKTNPNEPKTNPISKKAKINVTACLTMNYEQQTTNYEIKNEPKTKPISRSKHATVYDYGWKTQAQLGDDSSLLM